MAARRTMYAHNAEPPVPSASDEPDTKLWLADIIPQPAEKELEVHLDDPEVVVAEPQAKEKEKPELAVQAPEPEPVHEEQKTSADDEAFKRLKAQLDRELKARESERERIRQLESDRTAVQERLRQEQERYLAAQREQLDAQELAIENAIRHADAQVAQAKREIRRCLSEGDYDNADGAYEALAEAKADLVRLREGKSAIEAQKKIPVPQHEDVSQQRQPTSQYDRIEAYITQPGHSPRVQEYLRNHYDDLFRDFDSGANRLNRLLGGHYVAKSDGVIEGSDAYFDVLDRHMGYKETPATQVRSEEAAPPATTQPSQPKARNIPPAAPVSRGAQSDRTTSSTSITLTPAQVALCKETGVDPRDYARHLLKIRAGGQDPNYTGPRFTADLQ